jgi:hypothetical protein
MLDRLAVGAPADVIALDNGLEPVGVLLAGARE